MQIKLTHSFRELIHPGYSGETKVYIAKAEAFESHGLYKSNVHTCFILLRYRDNVVKNVGIQFGVTDLIKLYAVSTPWIGSRRLALKLLRTYRPAVIVTANDGQQLCLIHTKNFI